MGGASSATTTCAESAVWSISRVAYRGLPLAMVLALRPKDRY
jgi:hypothetical protein